MKRSPKLIKKYTAFAPNTVRATKKAQKALTYKINYFLQRTTNTVKNTGKMLNKSTSKIINSMTRKRLRR